VADEDGDELDRPAFNAEETSHEAFELQQDGRGARTRTLVLLALQDAGMNGLTDHELHDLIAPGAPDGGPRNRRVDLVRAGLVTKLRDSEGREMRRPSRSGASSMIVWRAVEPGEFVPRPKSRGVDKLRARLTEAIVASLQDRDGCGSDLQTVGDALEDDTWLFVSGALDVHHLVSDVLTVLGKE
jgi:hypothetical protein